MPDCFSFLFFSPFLPTGSVSQPLLPGCPPFLCKIKEGQEEEDDRGGGWWVVGGGVWRGLREEADRQNRTSLMLSEAEVVSITHAQGISVTTCSASASIFSSQDMTHTTADDMCACVCLGGEAHIVYLHHLFFSRQYSQSSFILIFPPLEAF